MTETKDINPSESGVQPDGLPKKAFKPIPLLLDVSFTASQILLLATGVLIAAISALSGAGWLECVIRSAAAVLSLGLLLYLVNWMLSRNSLEAARLQLLREIATARAAEENLAVQSTIEKTA
jgi:hypothetical protein